MNLNGLKIVCPQCQSSYLESDSESSNQEIHCTNCNSIFPMEDGVLDLLNEESPGMIPVAEPMKWKWLVKIYNSRLWRKSAWLGKLSFGISFDKESNLILNAANLTPNAYALDLACGPGTYTKPIAQALTQGKIVGFDISLPMLSYGAKQAIKEGLQNILYIHGTVRDLPFEKEQFDFINCSGALHLFMDFLPELLHKINDILKHGGRFSIAAARLPEGKWSKKLALNRSKNSGLKFFSPEELKQYLLEAGFIDVICHHSKRYWLVMSATKQ
ncbi:MAG: methyltransferase domain-containing protein [Candidatus Lokiarchaeota archaeon]